MESNTVIEKYLNKYNTQVKAFSAITTVAACVIAVASVYQFYRTNIWVPKVSVTAFDFDAATATINIGGTNCSLYGNSVLNAGGVWGVRFGTRGLSSSSSYDTIELVKNDMVYNVLQYKTT